MDIDIAIDIDIDIDLDIDIDIDIDIDRRSPNGKCICQLARAGPQPVGLAMGSTGRRPSATESRSSSPRKSYGGHP